MPKNRFFLLFLPCFVAGLITFALVHAGLGAAASDGQCAVPGDYPTIQAAVATQLCDTINVAAGTYPENVIISRTVTIQGQGAQSTIVDAGGFGRVFQIYSGAKVTLTGLTIANGNSTRGAGIYMGNGQVTVNDSTLSGNVASDYGGGIYNNISGIVTINNSTFSGNSADIGGGIYNYLIGTVTVNNSTLSSNSASIHGGGIWSAGNSTMSVNNSTLSGNMARSGGGIWNNGALMTVTNSTVSSNTATETGGGIGVDIAGIVKVAGTIIADNAATIDGPDCYGLLNSLDYNLIGNSAGCTVSGSSANNIYGQDPLLGPLQDNGGLTLTQALLTGSPAVDAGNNAACPAADQRGVLRPLDGDGDGQAICDVGSFELEETTKHVYLPVVIRH